MTKILSVEERATMFKEFYCECNGSMTSDAIYATTHRIITEDRLALLTELRDSGLLGDLKEDDVMYSGADNSLLSEGHVIGHNTLARNIKARLDELINAK